MHQWLGRIRLILAVAGLVFGIAGVATDNKNIIWAAIGLLGGAVLIRLLLRRGKGKQRLDE